MFVVGFVNYKTSLYMETQFKIYKDFAGEDFQIIVVDNSQNSAEFKNLLQVASNLSGAVEIIPCSPSNSYGSISHGEGLQHIYNIANKKYPDAKYFITQDPDFFWVKPNFLSLLKSELQTNITIGAPYHYACPVIGGGHPWFPAAFGAAFVIDALQEIGADFKVGDKVQGSCDVGWRVRQGLSNKPYHYFEQESFASMGPYSFEMIPRRYLENNEPVAYHLHRGSFEMGARRGYQLSKGNNKRKQRLRQEKPPQEWQENRKKMCDFFWKEINDASKRSV